MHSKTKRITREDLFMKIAHEFGQRSTCPRASVGAIAVREGRIISTGYNGAPAGMPHCLEVGCQIERVMQYATKAESDHYEDGYEEHCTRTVHAEANAVAWSARAGVSLQGASMFTTHGLCTTCAKLVINAGFQAVYYDVAYQDDGLELIRDAGLLLFHHPLND